MCETSLVQARSGNIFLFVVLFVISTKRQQDWILECASVLKVGNYV